MFSLNYGWYSLLFTRCFVLLIWTTILIEVDQTLEVPFSMTTYTSASKLNTQVYPQMLNGSGAAALTCITLSLVREPSSSPLISTSCSSDSGCPFIGSVPFSAMYFSMSRRSNTWLDTGETHGCSGTSLETGWGNKMRLEPLQTRRGRR